MTNIFTNRKPIPDKLRTFGFTQQQDTFTYRAPLVAGLSITVTVQGEDVTSTVTDDETGEPYTLYLTPANTGSFVAQVRAAVNDCLKQIADACFTAPTQSVFTQTQTLDVIAAVADKYGDTPEFLWQKFPGNAVFRRPDTHKWYAAILKVQAAKLGLPGNDELEVLDMRADPDELAALVDNQRYFPGYHMNKKHWYTIVLDDQVATAELRTRIEASYALAK
jgi:predicted DNA-binding protein (MmcQ/YjbR family)